MKTLRELLIEYNQAEDYDIDDGSLEETLRECFDVAWEGSDREHRWRIDYDVVVKIPDGCLSRFFKFTSCKGTNDNSWEDAGYVFEGIDNVVEVYPKAVTKIIYTTEEE